MLGIFGTINAPSPLAGGYGEYDTTGLGLAGFLNNVLKLIILVAGLYMIVNFILGGYGIMSSEGQPEKLTKAQNKIYMSILGLVVIVGSFALAALIGYLLFKDPTAILQIKIYGP